MNTINFEKKSFELEELKSYRILLYYKYVKIDNPETVRIEQMDFCRAHDLLGRILVASEGLNGTISGTIQSVNAYMNWMKAHPLFAGIEFKVDEHNRHAFLKLHVRVKNEIVRLGLKEDVNPLQATGKYIEPEEFRELLKKTDDSVVILDARSSYEFTVGKFKNAKTFDITNFRELPERLEDIKDLKDKTIVTYCTGGIKCEKASALLLREGFTNVFQLHGGIVRYGHEVGGEDFDGQCYVFDQRVVVPVNTVNPVVIGSCTVCGQKTEKMINCANAECNAHVLVCEDCSEKLEGCCSEKCTHSPKKRTYDGTGYYLRGVNSKNYKITSEK